MKVQIATLKPAQSGASLVELAICVPVVFLLGMGTVQLGLVYHAKTTLNYATFEAAREGAVNHALAAPMRKELGQRLGPVFGGTGNASSALAAMATASLDVQDPRYTRMQILSPSKAAFDDWGVFNPQNGKLEIPNSHLRQRHRESVIKPHSGVNLQDANLLRIKVTYGYQLSVPLLGKWFAGLMLRFDPRNALYYRAQRLPLTSVATVRMHSPAWLVEHSTAGTDPAPSDGNEETPAASAPPDSPVAQVSCDAHGLPDPTGEGGFDATLGSGAQTTQCDVSVVTIHSLLDAVDPCYPR